MNENQWSGPTQYRNQIFKSTLEARWAVFFDQLKLNWKYEPKRHVFGHGYSYTPTFFVQDIGWIEVNPTIDELHKVISKLYFFKKRICSYGGDFFVFCASEASDQIIFSIIEIIDRLKIIEGFEFAYCSHCEKYILESQNNDFYNSRHCEHKRHSSIVCDRKSLIYEALRTANSVNIINQIENKTRIITSH